MSTQGPATPGGGAYDFAGHTLQAYGSHMESGVTKTHPKDPEGLNKLI